jgi:hypothetical protein
MSNGISRSIHEPPRRRTICEMTMQVASQISKLIKIFGSQSALVRLVTEHWDGSHVYAAFPLRQALNRYLCS